MMPDLHELATQALKALGYYATLLVMMRLAGKRLAGQTTTFDLLVLITLGVTVQQVYLTEGTLNLVVFVVVVFAAHRSLAAEGVSRDDLLAGLRRLGFEQPAEVRLAVLEETGHISAVAIDRGAATGSEDATH